MNPQRVDEKPATCVGCRKHSHPRPMGVVPEGWSKENGGKYWCSGCKKVDA